MAGSPCQGRCRRAEPANAGLDRHLEGPAEGQCRPGPADAGRAPRRLRPRGPPLFAALAGLPPLLVQIGTADLLLSDSERLGAAAAQGGVDVTLQIGEGLPHVYQLLLGTPEAAQATEQIGKFLRARVR